MKTMFSLSNLNEAQIKAVTTTDGASMILAGAGSGKTRTLVSRISYLLAEKKISPFQILALTFSNKAAREMRERVSKDVNIDVGALEITTFHSFCARVLRNEYTYLGLSKNFTIYDDTESKAIAKVLIKKRGLTTKEMSPFEVLNFISEIKNNGHYSNRENNKTKRKILSLDEFKIDKEDELYEYYDEYESELHKANAVDFGGLITGVIELFETHPTVLDRYQNKFKYILIDEYQDTNRAQFALVQMLSESHRNICVVGDEDQSIYSWRGADIRNILDFEKIFPEVCIIKLEQNYRSSKNIIEAATCVISRNEMRKGKEMWTENIEGDSIEIIENSSDKQEGEFIAKRINCLAKEGVGLDEIAIFYRTNSQSRTFEDYLRKSNISYRVVGGVKFYERKEIKDLLAYIRLLINPKDSLALSRIINVPTRGLGATSLRKIEGEAVNLNLSLWETIEDIVNNYEKYNHLRLSAKIKSSLLNFVSLISEGKIQNDDKSKPSIIYEKLLHESGYWDYLKSSKDYESLARIENLQELSHAIQQYEESTPNPTLVGFLETVTLDTSSNDDAEGNSTENYGEVSLMTVHGAKGLEFLYVFLAGAEENVFPSYMSLENGEMGIEEERRLFYVAMTRAMKKLYISFAQGRMLFGQLKFNGPSRFINEIPEKLYIWQKPYQEDHYNSDQDWKDYEFDQTVSDETPIYKVEKSWKASKYPKGSNIVHAVYGKGLVLDTEGYGNSEKVLIRFSDGTKKRFMVKFAPLVIA